MEIPNIHPWPGDQNEAVDIQHRLQERILITGSLDNIKLIAGVETAFDHTSNMLFSAVCLFTWPGMEEYERATAAAQARFPYIRGLHAFREGPVILRAFSHLNPSPDLIMFAGHGLAHPRRIGLASHLGLILDIPSLGCARKKLVGQHDELDQNKGASAPLIVDNDEVGRVYRTRDKVKPVFISPGHRCGLEEAVRVVVGCVGDYRIPEPMRAAHRLANRLKRNHKKNA
jgi:deoxyribonuclease V